MSLDFTEMKAELDQRQREHLDALRAKVNDRREHCRQIEKSYSTGLPVQSDSDGPKVVEDAVEPLLDTSKVDRPSASKHQVASSAALGNQPFNSLTHVLLLRLELFEARLDLIEATVGVSHEQSLVDLERLLCPAGVTERDGT